MSTVELLSRKDNVLRVEGLDIVNGAAILDIKPYTPRYDRVKNAQAPAWVRRLVL